MYVCTSICKDFGLIRLKHVFATLLLKELVKVPRDRSDVQTRKKSENKDAFFPSFKEYKSGCKYKETFKYLIYHSNHTYVYRCRWFIINMYSQLYNIF